MKLLWLASIIALLVCSTASTATAQIASEGSIRGFIKDEQGAALPGVSLSATTPQSSTSFTAVSDSQGFYRLVNLPPGIFDVVAVLSGFAKFERKGLEVRAEVNIQVDVVMKIGAIEETIQVTGESPMLEVQKTTQAINISGEFQRSLPLSSRRVWQDALDLTPGIMSRSTDQFGGSVYFLRGTENENHVVQVDGVDAGSFRQNWPGQYLGLSSEALADIQIKTAGVDAAAPLAEGMVINIATPSGTNQLKGSLSVVYTAIAWNGNNTPGGTPVVSRTVQPDLALGGPILKDKAWFFGTFRYTNRLTGVSRSSTLLDNLEALVPGFEPFNNKGRLKFASLKGTTQWTQNHHFQVTYQRDANVEETNFQVNGANVDVTALGGAAYGTRLASVWGDRVTTRILVGYNDKSNNSSFNVFDGHLGNGPSRPVHTSSFISAGRRTGSGRIALLDNLETRTLGPASKTTVSADLTYFKPAGWLGSHEIQTGMYLQPRLRHATTAFYSNDGFALEEVALRDPNNPAAGVVPFHRRYYGVPSINTLQLHARDNAVYVQDSWKPSARLTINAGVRVDWIKATDAIFDLDTVDDVAVGPRVGSNYSLTSDNKNLVRASYGRVGDVPNSSYIGSAGTSVAGIRDEYDNDLDGTFESVFVTPGSSRVSQNRRIDPDRRWPWVDEMLVGYRRQLPGQMTFDVSWISREYRHRPALVEVNGIYDGGVFRGYQDVSQNEINLVTDNEWNSFVYRGLEFDVTKRTDRLQLIANYTRARQHVAGTWQPNDPASFIQPEAFPNNRGLGTIRGNVTNSLSGTADTRNPMWEDHQARFGAVYFAPWSLVVATNFSVQSGPYSGPVVTRIAAADPRFGPSTVTLSNGRVVSNPLATTIRFAGKDRGDKQIKAPYLNVINLRVGRNFGFGSRRLETAFDVFNLLNAGTDQQFFDGGNQLYSSNYAIRDDKFFGVNRQPPRQGQFTVRFTF
ncbi:MAG: TonB-dependent receptor [Acidobacteria bacterium]|nr:TonB-dependent receptor [Acidobacteriota bacterium]